MQQEKKKKKTRNTYTTVMPAQNKNAKKSLLSRKLVLIAFITLACSFAESEGNESN